jgi:hypothetical protein
MMHHALHGAVAAERQRDMIAAAAHARSGRAQNRRSRLARLIATRRLSQAPRIIHDTVS